MNVSSNVRQIPIKTENSNIGFANVYEMTKYVQGEIRVSNMKYKDIAKRAGVGYQTVSRIACGETKDPRVGTVIKILFSLGKQLYVR